MIEFNIADNVEVNLPHNARHVGVVEKIYKYTDGTETLIQVDASDDTTNRTLCVPLSWCKGITAKFGTQE